MCNMKPGKRSLRLILAADHFRNLKGSDFQKDRQGCRRKVNLPVERKRSLFMGDVSEIARRLPVGSVQYGWSRNHRYYSNLGCRLLGKPYSEDDPYYLESG